jgi:hypothetical protein
MRALSTDSGALTMNTAMRYCGFASFSSERNCRDDVGLLSVVSRQIF